MPNPHPMHIIHSAMAADTGASLPEVVISVERRTMAKRLWRAFASDGLEFGFELDVPLRHRDVVFVTSEARYVVRQLPEVVLEVPLGTTAEAAAKVGWTAGNLHCPVDVQPGRLLVGDDKGLRHAFERAHIPYREACEVFQPFTMPGGHGHGHGHDHGDTHAHSHAHEHEHADGHGHHV